MQSIQLLRVTAKSLQDVCGVCVEEVPQFGLVCERCMRRVQQPLQTAWAALD